MCTLRHLTELVEISFSCPIDNTNLLKKWRRRFHANVRLSKTEPTKVIIIIIIILTLLILGKKYFFGVLSFPSI